MKMWRLPFWFLIILILFNPILANCQSAGENNMVYVVVENQPKFPGGMTALFNYLEESVVHPESVSEISGRVVLRFVVNKDGSITDIEVVKKLHPDLSKEAIRVVQEMPLWQPGYQDGVPVRVYYTLPVRFGEMNSEVKMSRKTRKVLKKVSE